MKYPLNPFATRQGFHQLSTAIGGAIIHQNDFTSHRCFTHPLDNLCQGGGLVINRYNNADNHSKS